MFNASVFLLLFRSSFSFFLVKSDGKSFNSTLEFSFSHRHSLKPVGATAERTAREFFHILINFESGSTKWVSLHTCFGMSFVFSDFAGAVARMKWKWVDLNRNLMEEVAVEKFFLCRRRTEVGLEIWQRCAIIYADFPLDEGIQKLQ